jgi:hypothetical protein
VGAAVASSPATRTARKAMDAAAAILVHLADPSTGGCAGGSSQLPWLGYFAPMGAPFPPICAPWTPPNAGGVLGPRPGAPTQAYPIMTYTGPAASTYPYPALPAPQASYPASPYSFDQSAMIHGAFSNSYNVQPQGDEPWVMDSGDSSHVTGKSGNLTSTHSNLGSHSSHIIVGNGSKLPILAVGSVKISSLPL